MRSRSTLVSAVVLVVLAAGAAAAQTPPAQAPIQGFSITGFGRVEGRYDDNFFRTDASRQSEYREILTPGLLVRAGTGKSTGSIAYSPSLVHSSINQNELQIFHLLDARGSLSLTEHLSLEAFDNLSRTDEPAVTDPNGARRDRRTSLVNLLGLALPYRQQTWSLTPRYGLTFNDTQSDTQTTGTTTQTTGAVATASQERSLIHSLGLDGSVNVRDRNKLGLGYELTVARYEVNTGNDFVGHTGRASFARELSPLMTASITGTLAHRDPETGDPFNIYRGDIGFRRDVSPRYTTEVRVGAFATDAISGSNSHGLEYTLRGTYTGNWVTLFLDSGESLQETFQEVNNVGLTRTKSTSASVRFTVSDRLAITVGGRLAQSEFLQSSNTSGVTTVAGNGQTRQDQTLEANLEASYKLSRRFTLGLRYTHTDVDSNVRGLGYAQNVVTLGLTATYE
jgi:hypothetical protein